MIWHCLKLNLLSYFGNLFVVATYAYFKAPSIDDSFYKGLILVTIYLCGTQLIFGVLCIFYFLVRLKHLSRNQKIIIFLMPHLIYFLVLIFTHSELIFFQSFINILAYFYTYTQFITKDAEN